MSSNVQCHQMFKCHQMFNAIKCHQMFKCHQKFNAIKYSNVMNVQIFKCHQMQIYKKPSSSFTSLPPPPWWNFHPCAFSGRLNICCKSIRASQRGKVFLSTLYLNSSIDCFKLGCLKTTQKSWFASFAAILPQLIKLFQINLVCSLYSQPQRKIQSIN